MSIYKLKGTSGRFINQSFVLGDLLVLGSSPDCELQVEEPGVADHHAEIVLLDGQSLLLKDLGSGSGTQLNGEPVREAILQPGDEIQVGSCRWILQAPGLKPARVLTAEVVGKPSRDWLRLIVWVVLAAAALALVILEWKPEWLSLG